MSHGEAIGSFVGGRKTTNGLPKKPALQLCQYSKKLRFEKFYREILHRKKYLLLRSCDGLRDGETCREASIVHDLGGGGIIG